MEGPGCRSHARAAPRVLAPDRLRQAWDWYVRSRHRRPHSRGADGRRPGGDGRCRFHTGGDPGRVRGGADEPSLRGRLSGADGGARALGRHGEDDVGARLPVGRDRGDVQRMDRGRRAALRLPPPNPRTAARAGIYRPRRGGKPARLLPQQHQPRFHAGTAADEQRNRCAARAPRDPRADAARTRQR